MKTLQLFFLVSLFLFSTKALAAGLYIEPGIFYEKGDNKIDWSAPLSSSTGTTKGLGVDLKLGINWDSKVFLALDGSYARVKFENSATDYSADADSTTYGAILGAQFPHLGFRGWVGYVFGGKLAPDASGSYKVKFEDPKGLKLGVGFKILIVSLNIEYLDLKYDTSTVEQPIGTTFDNKLKNKIGRISVSFPLTF